MKKLLLTIAAVITASTAFGQGEVIFNNRLPFADAGIWLDPGQTTRYVSAQEFTATPSGNRATVYGAAPGATSGAAYTAQLLLVSGNGDLVPLGTTDFRTGAAGGYFLNAKSIAVPGVPAGSSATFRIRVWETAAGSYDAAEIGFFRGESNDVTVGALGGTPPSGPAVPTPFLADPNNALDPTRNLQAFGLVMIPEPSTIALGVLGAAALMLRRRRK